MEIQHINEVNYEKLTRIVKIIIPAKNAKLSPPVGPVLGQVKIKVKDFCTQFNASTDKLQEDLPLKVLVYVYKNETFNYKINPPSVCFLIKNLLKYNKQSKLKKLDVYKIMKIKSKEFPQLSEQLIFRNILNIIKKLNILII